MIPLSILVVHPDPERGSRIARVVAAAGHAPILLVDGERAIDRFVLEPADALIVGFFLPGRDGVATAEAIRWAPGGRDAHVLLFSERETDPPLRELAARVDAVAVVVSPTPEDEIAEALAQLGRPAMPEHTRVADLGELDPHLERLGRGESSSSVPIDKRPTREVSTPERIAGAAAFGEDLKTAVEDDAERAWPQVETVFVHAAPRGRLDVEDSGVKARPMPDAVLESVPEPDEAPSRPASIPPAPEGKARRSPSSSSGEPSSDEDPVASEPHRYERATRPGRHRIAEEQRNTAEWTPDASELAEDAHVREGARASEGTLARFEGEFTTRSFPSLMRELADARMSGALVCVGADAKRQSITGDPPTKIVYFRGGVPIHVRSNLLDECLGQMLVRRRRIGIATLEESIRRVRLGEGLQGELLVDMGALAPIELGEALADQAREKLFDLFGWARGSYRLSTKLEPPDGSVGIEMALAEIVYEGVCAAMPPTRLLSMLSPSLERFVVPDPVQLARFVRVRLVPEVRHVLARIDGSLPLRDLLAMGSRPGAVAQLIYAMHCLGAVSFSALPKVPENSAAAAASAAASAAAGAEAAIPRSTPISGEFSQRLVRPGDESDAAEPSEPPAGESEAGLTDHWDEDTLAPGPEPIAPSRSGLMPSTGAPDSSAEVSGVSTSSPPGPREEAPAAADGGDIDARVDRLFEAERLFRKARSALERGRFDDAFPVFARAAELCPDQGEFLAYVGWSRHCRAPDAADVLEEALAELARARELAPELSVTHLLHARVLAAGDQVGEARAAYETALAQDAGCKEAADALAKL